MTSAQVAEKTKLNERYVREWLSAQAAGGFLTYDAAGEDFHAASRAGVCAGGRREPRFSSGIFSDRVVGVKDEPKIEEGFRTGKGVGWHEHDHELFHGHRAIFPAELPRASGE